jgi:hypothetical protein
MIYTVAFINKQELRDIKLEEIFNPDFVESSYVHTGLLDYTAQFSTKINILSYTDIYWKERAILGFSKWKTIRGAQDSIKKYHSNALKLNVNRTPRITNVELFKNEYVPVVYDITFEWNKIIQSKIDAEIFSHNKKLKTLTNKLAK